MRQNLQDKISCTHFVKYLLYVMRRFCLNPSWLAYGEYTVWLLAGFQVRTVICNTENIKNHPAHFRYLYSVHTPSTDLSDTGSSLIHPEQTYQTPALHRYTQYIHIRHQLFTDTPSTDLSDTCSSLIHPVQTYQTPALYRYTQYIHIRHLLFTDTPSTDLSDTCSSQIHLEHSYQTPALH